MATKSITSKLPLWKWVLLMVGLFILAIVGNGILQSLAFATISAGFPLLNVVLAAAYLVIYALFVKWLERHWPTDLPLRRLASHTLLGLIIGFVFMVMVIATITAMGCANEYWAAFSWNGQFQALMLFLVVAVTEEVACRGVLFRLIDQRWGTIAALVVSALIFGFGHLPNDNATWWSSLAIAIEAGLLLGAAYKWSGNLWLPIGIHWAWNYTQGNIFGLEVSGVAMGEHVISTTVNGPDIITGGAFGPEASIVCVFFGLLLTIFFLTNCYRR